MTLNSAVNTQGYRQLLAAGGSEDTADQDYSFLNFGGGYFGTNLFLLEGGYDVAQGWGGSQYVPAPEDTDQVKVTSYEFSAEYGFSTGNAISITTKAGTSNYHFLADEYLRNPDCGRQPLLQQPRTACHGLTTTATNSGSPVAAPCTFRAFINSGTKPSFSPTMRACASTVSGAYSANVPTTAQLGGDFSSELTTKQVGTDALCRPIYQGAIYNPYTSRSVVATCGTANNTVGQTVYIRDPYPGNNIPATGPGAIDALAEKFASRKLLAGAEEPGRRLQLQHHGECADLL